MFSKLGQFVSLSAALVFLPLAADAEPRTLDFTPGIVEEQLAAGNTVLLDFKASWCVTCKKQERVIRALRDSIPEFDEHIVFVNVDWDRFGKHPIALSLNIPRRSTLVLLRGDEELGRIVAGTSTKEIRALLDLGLPEAS